MRFLVWTLAFCLLLAACGQDPDEKIETPSLREYTPESLDQFTAAVHPALVATPDPSLPALQLTAPTCQETPTQTFVCLGWLQNPLDVAYTNISLSIDLLDENQQIIASQTGILARDWLPARSGAPYRLIFPEVPAESVTPLVTLLGVNEAAENPATLKLEVQNIVTEAIVAPSTSSAYLIKGEVVNNTSERVEPVSVVVTLRDEAGQVAGFRILQLDQLIPGARIAFETTVISEGIPADQIEITADGYRRE